MFSTTKKKLEAVEKYAAPVITYYPSAGEGSNSYFGLNKAAMEAFGFPMNTPNQSRIANGYDDSNNLVLAAIDTKDIYTNNVTAKNTFSSKKLVERLSSVYADDFNSKEITEFGLVFDGDTAILALIVPDDIPEETFIETPPTIEEIQDMVEDDEPVNFVNAESIH